MRTTIALAALLAAAPAHAAVITYELTGTSLDTCHEVESEFSWCSGIPLGEGVLDGFVHIDERLLSAPLAGRTWSVEIPAQGHYEATDGEHRAISGQFGFIDLVTMADSTFRLTTDENGNPIRWKFNGYEGGSLESAISNRQSLVYSLGGEWAAGRAGTLSLYSAGAPYGSGNLNVAPVPLPSGIWLSLAGIGAFVSLYSRRRSGSV